MNGQRILVVADHVHLWTRICKFLWFSGYMAFWAPNGAVALTVIDEERPDLVLLEVTTAVDGDRLLDAILAKRPDLPVVILSASADVASASRALSRGAADYVVKPFKLRYLAAIIATHLPVTRRTR
jgi:DNA-binding response OmpR family regulator